MRKSVLILGAAFALCCSPSLAQPIDANSALIIVEGRGHASRPADYGALSFTVRGEGATNILALKALAVTRDKVEEGLKALVKTTSIEFQAGELSVKAARDSACTGDSGDFSDTARLSTGNCQIKGYVASLSFTVQVTPADRIGDAASLVAELGGVDVTANSGGVTNAVGLVDEATKIALEDAHRQALAMASAAGVQLGPIVRIQDNAAPMFEVENPTAYPMHSPPKNLPAPAMMAHLSPAVPLVLAPAPVEQSVNYTVIYAIVR